MRPHTVRLRPLALTRLLALPVVAAGLIAAVLLPASAARADVDDFSYSSWSSDYRVSLDADGHAVAHVTETVVAEFPDTDQNKGIIRGYPQRYEGAGLSIRILSVKDAKGRAVPFETETEDGMLLVLTGNDDYVHGSTTYVIESTMRDVMIHGAKTGNDEFYWNLLPLNSTQAIGRFHASLTFSPQLAAALTGDAACYSGQAGEKMPCTLTGPTDSADGATFAIDSGERAPGDGITAAIGFTAGTVTQPDARKSDPIADFGPAAIGLGTIGTAIGAWVSVAAMTRRRRKATGIIVAQYDVPADMSPLAAAALIPAAPNPIPAEMVHLAVRGALRLEEEQGEKKPRPSLRLLDRTRLSNALDRAAFDSLFSSGKTVVRIPRSSTKFATRMDKLVARGRSEARQDGWLSSERSRGAVAFGWASVALFAITVAAMIWAATKDREMFGLSLFAVIVAGGS